MIAPREMQQIFKKALLDPPLESNIEKNQACIRGKVKWHWSEKQSAC